MTATYEIKPDGDRLALKEPESIFALSFRGGVPELLRALADRIESGDATVERFAWDMTQDKLTFTAVLDMGSQGGIR